MLGLMYLHAYRMREHLGLNELEAIDTRISCERLLLPLPVFPPAVAALGIDTAALRGRYGHAVAAAVIALEAGIFVYLAWAVRRSRRLKARRADIAGALDVPAVPEGTVPAPAGIPEAASASQQ